ncbi:hypothetical protein MFIFM68171_04781 [Madurella fahalii]|uniref:C2H2-type domain-containing protein n=1 Tax=Madurella fahalii TaxID=1157608 RepID=A0ABQ0GA12_9PEZI
MSELPPTDGAMYLRMQEYLTSLDAALWNSDTTTTPVLLSTNWDRTDPAMDPANFHSIGFSETLPQHACREYHGNGSSSANDWTAFPITTLNAWPSSTPVQAESMLIGSPSWTHVQTGNLHAGPSTVPRRSPAPDNRLKCLQCGKRFSRSDSLGRHARVCPAAATAIVAPSHVCEYCEGERRFARRDHLLQHFRGYHKMSKAWVKKHMVRAGKMHAAVPQAQGGGSVGASAAAKEAVAGQPIGCTYTDAEESGIE